MSDKSILISIQPQWCELIVEGRKTLEVRKSKPKLKPPFKCYIYCTKEKNINETLWTCGVIGNLSDKANGRIIGEFICDTVECVGIPYPAYSGELDRQYIEKSCINYSTLHEFCGHGNLYFWHISNLQIYDKPKKLTDFKQRSGECLYEHLGFPTPECEDCLECRLKRPPQSWCYIIEEE